MNRKAKHPSTEISQKRGSALVITMIFTAILLTALGSTLNLTFHELKLASRTGASEAAFSLAESGLEEGLWALNEYGSNSTSWTNAGWNISQNGNYYSKTWNLSTLTVASKNSYEFADNRIGEYKVIVEKTAGANITILAKGSVTDNAGASGTYSIDKYVETTIEWQNPLIYGLITGYGIDFSGKPGMASYDSRIPPYLPSNANSGSEVKVGSTDNDKANIDLGNTIVNGDILTGDTNVDNSYFLGNHTGNITWGFKAVFPDVEKPDTTQGSWITTTP